MNNFTEALQVLQIAVNMDVADKYEAMAVSTYSLIYVMCDICNMMCYIYIIKCSFLYIIYAHRNMRSWN